MRHRVTALAVLTSVVLLPAARAQDGVAALATVPGFSLSVLTDEAVGGNSAPDLGSHVSAFEQKTNRSDEAWEYSFAPYLWVPGAHGKMMVKGHTARVDDSIGDTFNNLDELNAAFIGHFEARQGESGLMVDVVYLDLANSSHLPGGAGDLDTEAAASINEFGGFQELARWDDDPQDPSACTLEAFGGIRTWYVSADVDVDAAGIHGSGSEFWVDPFIGMRLLTQLDARWAMNLRADIGGFGALNGSDSTWQGIGTITYATSETGQLGFGWRALSVDYDHGNFAMNMTLSGPFIGYNFRF